MAENTEASPICRGKNLTWDTILLFFNNMPKQPMPKADFNAYVEQRITGWTQTHSQIARQLAFYYEDNGTCYPRFTEPICFTDLYNYVRNWAAKYFIPNPYAPSLKGQTPTSIYKYLKEEIKRGENDFDSSLDNMFDIALSSHDKVRCYLNNFTNILIDQGTMRLNEDVIDTDVDLHPDFFVSTDPKAFFNYFSIGALSRDNTKVESSTLGNQSDVIVDSLRTKPFLLLAGISGTGKSQKVQELAFMTCPEELREKDSTTPGNYCLIEVKPNWHDSTELLGYYSTLSGKYELTKFIRFAYKAIQNPNTPFFVCLDEMNLAPVEQYFAEYLSVLETRKREYNEDTKKYEIHTEPLLDKDVFASCVFTKTEAKQKPNSYLLDTNTYTKTVDLYDTKDKSIIEFLKANGLHIPENLFVIGTVNMDDTTHQFSRKVIDRAFTIEMNGGKMEDMFTPQSKKALEYRDEPVKLEEFKSEFVKAYEVLEDSRFAKYQSVISSKIPALLGDSDGHAAEGSLNGILNKTPFRVSYRVQNELVLYLSTLIERAEFPDNIDSLIGEAFLAILLEKVLPRIQGEAKQLETKDGKSNILKDMMGFVKEKFPKSNSVEQQPESSEDTVLEDLFDEAASKEDKPAPSSNLYDQVMTKLDEMDKKLTGYYTNFF